MTFTTNHQFGFVGPEGPKDAKIAFIGESPGRDEVYKKRPFVGAAGYIFEQCLHAAGLIRGQVYITNLSKYPMGDHKERFYNDRTHSLTQEGNKLRMLLAAELRVVKANILVPMGDIAGCAVLGDGIPITSSKTGRRGYIAAALDVFGNRKTIPTCHPASCLYGGNYINIHYIAHDFLKASENSEKSEIEYRRIIPFIPESFDECITILRGMRGKSPIGFDIETINYEPACIGFSHDGVHAVCIPFGDVWSIEEEIEIWGLVDDILGDLNTIKIVHNSIFDIFELLTRVGVVVRGEVHDTMIGHSLIYPEFWKSLQFISSIYDNIPYWKNMVKFSNVKEES
jgi:DNA polymerase